MVSSIGYKLSQNRLVTGFGTRRRTTRGTGVARRTIGALSRPALTFVANKLLQAVLFENVKQQQLNDEQFRAQASNRLDTE